jgi:protein gp37
MTNPIGYVDRTWNPITGCLATLPCWKNCWAKKMAHRMCRNFTVKGAEKYDGFLPAFWPDRLKQPLHWKHDRPQRVAVGFMGDIALQRKDDIQQVAEVCAMTPWHTYLWLTKRPEMLAVKTAGWQWPRNIWLGVSVSTQKDADTLLPVLAGIPAARRWVSVEPMLEGIDLALHLAWLDFVVCGPETGAGARECNEKWILDLYWECEEREVAFWDKREEEWVAREVPSR